MDTTPVLTVKNGLRSSYTEQRDDPPFVDRISEKVRTLAAVKPALVRLLEWHIDEELERTEKGGRRDDLPLAVQP